MIDFKYLYLSHFLTQWGDKIWTFAAPILFVDLLPVSSLFPPTFFIFLHTLACVIFEPLLGALLDRMNRLHAIRLSLFVANASVALCAACLYAISVFSHSSSSSSADSASFSFFALLSQPLFLAFFVLVNLFGCLAELASAAARLSLTKDWLVALSVQDPLALTAANALLHRIGLICNIVAPFFFAVVLDASDRRAALLLVVTWNAISFLPEYFLLRHLYHQHPILASPRSSQNQSQNQMIEKQNESNLVQCQNNTKTQHQSITATPNASAPSSSFSSSFQLISAPWSALQRSWACYFRHHVFLSSISYALLYATVLSDGAQITAYLTGLRVSATSLALFRAASSVLGVCSTLLAKPLIARLGRVRAGQCFLGCQLGCLLTGCALFFPSSSTPDATLHVFLACIVLSRFGLWGFDLAQMGHMQLLIEEPHRGAINGAEGATCKLAWLSILCLGLIFNDPASFPILVVISLIAITLANGCYFYWQRYVVPEHYKSE